MVRILPLALCALGVMANLDDKGEDFLASHVAADAVRAVQSEQAQASLLEKEASAVAKAAGDALLSADGTLNDRVVALASEKAKSTYKRLRGKGVDAAAAAESAAVVAAAVVDQAKGQAESQEAVQAAETAAVLSERAVDSSPNNPAAAAQQAKEGIRHVVTGEAVAAAGAREGVYEAERAHTTDKEDEAGTAAADAAVAALHRVGHGASTEVETAAKWAAKEVYESLVDKKTPEDLAAKQAAEVAIASIDPTAPTLVKQSSEAAAEAAAKVVEEKQETGILSKIEGEIIGSKELTTSQLEAEAEQEAYNTVHAEKLAQRAAVEAVVDVEDERVFPGSQQGQAEAAARAALDSMAAMKVVEQDVADAALAKGQESFLAAAAKKGATLQSAAEVAADAVVTAIDKKSAGDVFATAEAAAVAAAKALKENAGRPNSAIEEAKTEAADDFSEEEARRANESQATITIWMFFAFALAFMGYQQYSQNFPSLNKYQVAAMSAVQEETMDTMERGSILLTDQGFNKF